MNCLSLCLVALALLGAWTILRLLTTARRLRREGEAEAQRLRREGEAQAKRLRRRKRRAVRKLRAELAQEREAAVCYLCRERQRYEGCP